MPRAYQKQAPHQKQPTLTGMVAHWKLNDANDGDAAADSSSNNIDLDPFTDFNVIAGPHLDADAIAGKGARQFDNASWLAEPTGNEGAWAATLQDGYGFTIGCWAYAYTGWNSNGTIVTYDAYGGGEDQNIQVRLEVLSTREVFVRWEYDSGSNVDIYTGYFLPEEEWTHLAIVVCQDDRAQLSKRKFVLYVNGEPEYLERNLQVMTGGADSYWQIGASFDASSDAGATPDKYFGSGALSDIAVYPFAGTPEFCRDLYARGIKDFQLSSDIKIDGTESSGAKYYDETLEHIAMFSRVKVKLLPSQESTSSAEFADVLGWVDLTDIFDSNAVISVEVEDNIDAQTASASVVISSRLYGELGFTVQNSTSISALLYDNPILEVVREGHEIKIEFAAMPHGSTEEDAAPHFMLHFHGVINAATESADTINLQCIDLGQGMQDQFVEPKWNGGDFKYGDTVDIEDNLQSIMNLQVPNRLQIMRIENSGAGGKLEIEVFDNASGYGRPHQFVAGELIYIFATNAGTFDGEWTIDSVTANQITTVETYGGGLTGDMSTSSSKLHGVEELGYIGATPGYVGAVEIVVPTSPGWVQTDYNLPSTQNVMQAIEEQCSQIGWLCRYRWDDDRKQFRLTFYDPAEGITRAGSISPNLVLVRSDLGFSSENKRNIVVVEHLNSGSPLPDGSYPKDAVAAVDKTTRERYRRRYARMGLFQHTNIDTSAEATLLAEIALDSMASDAHDNFSVTIPYNARYDIGKYVEMSTEVDGYSGGALTVWPYSQLRMALLRYPDNKFLIVGVRVQASVRGVLMTLTLRPYYAGAATAGGQSTKYKELITQRGITPGDGNSGVANGTSAPTLTALSATSIHVIWDAGVRSNVLSKMYLHTEVHISTTNGFTPSSTTLAETTSSLTATIRRTIDGSLTVATSTTYYIKCIHVDVARNRVTSAQANVTTP